MKNLLLVPLLILVVISFILAGCSGTSTPTATQTQPAATQPTSTPAATQSAATKTLTIGIATPLTGNLAFLGTQIRDTVQMAINDQNAKGGVTIGGQKYTLVPMIRDTKGDAATGKSVGQEMISDGIKIIAGPFVADAIAMQPGIEANKVLTFFVACQTPAMTGPNKPYSFFVTYPYVQETYKILSYIQKTYPQAKNIYSIEADSPATPQWTNATSAAAKMLGFNWMGYETVPVDTTDFTSVINKILSHNPDIIETGSIGGTMGGLEAQLIKQLGQSGFKGVIAIPAAPPEEAVEQTVPAATLDQCVTQYINVGGPVVDPKYKDVMNEFNATYKQEPVEIVAIYYNVMMGLFQFLNTQNSMDPATWMQGFAQYKWNIVGYQSQWIQQIGDGINRRGFGNQWVTHYENGKPVTDYAAPTLPPGTFLDDSGNPFNNINP